MARNQDSRKLAENLAEQLEQAGWMVWVEMPTGQAWNGVGRVDVLAIAKSYHISIKAYEVKASRNDFLRDVNSGKFLKYQEFCTQFYFAAESGVLRLGDIPTGCGLITLGTKGWHVQKAPRLSKCQPTTDFMLALLMKNYQDHRPNLRSLREKGILEYMGLRDAAYKFGTKFAHDIVCLPEYLREARELQEKIDKALGKEHDDLFSSYHALKGEVSRLLSQYKYTEEITKLTGILVQLYQGQAYSLVPALQEITEQMKAKEVMRSSDHA